MWVQGTMYYMGSKSDKSTYSRLGDKSVMRPFSKLLWTFVNNQIITVISGQSNSMRGRIAPCINPPAVEVRMHIFHNVTRGLGFLNSSVEANNPGTGKLVCSGL